MAVMLHKHRKSVDIKAWEDLLAEVEEEEGKADLLAGSGDAAAVVAASIGSGKQLFGSHLSTDVANEEEKMLVVVGRVPEGGDEVDRLMLQKIDLLVDSTEHVPCRHKFKPQDDSSLIELLQLEIPLCPLAIFEWHTETVNLRAGVVLDLTLRALLLHCE